MTGFIRVPPTLKSLGCPDDATPEVKVQYQIVLRLDSIAYQLSRMNGLKEHELENK